MGWFSSKTIQYHTCNGLRVVEHFGKYFLIVSSSRYINVHYLSILGSPVSFLALSFFVTLCSTRALNAASLESSSYFNASLKIQLLGSS
jgi:hypothetical protein